MAFVHGGRLVAQALKRHGTTHLFTLCGGHIQAIYDGCIDDADPRRRRAPRADRGARGRRLRARDGEAGRVRRHGRPWRDRRGDGGGERAARGVPDGVHRRRGAEASLRHGLAARHGRGHLDAPDHYGEARALAAALEHTRYEKVVDACGSTGWWVETVEEVGPALDAAFAFAKAEQRPACVR
jgi:hypothetical protein